MSTLRTAAVTREMTTAVVTTAVVTMITVRTSAAGMAVVATVAVGT